MNLVYKACRIITNIVTEIWCYVVGGNIGCDFSSQGDDNPFLLPPAPVSVCDVLTFFKEMA